MSNTLFTDLSLSREVLKSIEELGFETATAIQAEAIPHIISGRDVIGQSRTGTGKTIAFAVPAVEMIDGNSDALERYLAAYIEGQRHVMDPANRSAMVELLTSRFKLAPGVAQGTYDAVLKPGSGLAPDAGFSDEGFACVLAIRAEMEGMWAGLPPAIEKYVDLSYYQSALNRI